MAKHAFIEPDEFLGNFREAVNHFIKEGFAYSSAVDDLVARSMRIKINFVKDDFSDTNGRQVFLSYGHTIANAIEELSNYKIRHGAAVAVGMLLSSGYSRKINLMSEKDRALHDGIINSIMNFALPDEIITDRIYQTLMRDKNSYKKMPRMLILKTFGEGKMIDVDRDILNDCIESLKNLNI